MAAFTFFYFKRNDAEGATERCSSKIATPKLWKYKKKWRSSFLVNLQAFKFQALRKMNSFQLFFKGFVYFSGTAIEDVLEYMGSGK